MPFRPFENQNCSIARAAEVFTERWMLLILREIMLGRQRFSEIKRNTGVASNILSDRLDVLVDQGVVVRVESKEDGAERYVPTQKGLDAQPILLAMLAWGNKYAYPNNAPRELFHETCGNVVNAKMVCDHCDGELRAENTKLRPGPGANKRQTKAGELRAKGRRDIA